MYYRILKIFKPIYFGLLSNLLKTQTLQDINRVYIIIKIVYNGTEKYL